MGVAEVYFNLGGIESGHGACGLREIDAAGVMEKAARTQ